MKDETRKASAVCRHQQRDWHAGWASHDGFRYWLTAEERALLGYVRERHREKESEMDPRGTMLTVNTKPIVQCLNKQWLDRERCLPK